MAEQLRDKVAHGVAWSAAEKIGSMLLQMVVSIIVARMLMPQDFGVLAILTFFTALSVVFIDSGFSQTLIRTSQPTEDQYKTVFIFNITTSLLLYGILVAISPLIAAYYKEPIITHIAPVLMLLLPLSALAVIQSTILVRQFRFATLSRINFTSSAIAGIVAITMAICGCGVWSLVAQRLALIATKTCLLWWKGSWRYSGCFKWTELRAMSHFSLRLMVTDTISYLYNNIAQLFIGKIYSASTLGYFNQAQKLKELPVTSAVQSFQSVTYPALANIKENPQKLTDSYLRVLMITAGVMFPVMAGMAVVAPDLFALLLGQRWMPTVPYFQILALSGLFYPISTISYNILKVASNGEVILKLEVAKKAIMTLLLAAAIPHSVTTVAWALTAMAAIELILNLAASLKFVTITAWDIIRALLPIAVITTLMCCAVSFIADIIPQATILQRLILQILAGIICYILLALLLRLPFAKDIVDTIRRMITKQ